ncbi:trans-aconitate 2-methyltransferase [Diplodia corticola]|uniref:Trans-aconitate 2-methyltransferase n=1 Tax=Diplodia corticola TaxID=236234 RepID=A0A1J9RD22_9PEZI|nr:trans-aconitate 2-methyltransferase [Diplodia corticola]OJD30419.1 trans-aconitate 2-methyltransferase [Diplodia corticola]
MSSPSASASAAGGIDWNAANYLRFADERTRPARDLLSALPPLPSPSSPRIIDLGCGPANSTALLAARYGCSSGKSSTGARITGVDSSPNMLAKARNVLPDAHFVQADLRSYQPPPPPGGAQETESEEGKDEGGGTSGGADLIFSNAALHWLPDAEIIPSITRWVGALRSPGGVFAMQVPDNVREPSHALMAVAAKRAGFDAPHVVNAGRKPFPDPRSLVEALDATGKCERVEVWQTVYWHRLGGGHRAVVEWLRESGLRPYLEGLEGEAERERLEGVYEESLREAYPALADGSVLLRFPRLFLVAVRK